LIHLFDLLRLGELGDSFVVMKHIGFLSFGHWSPSLNSETRSASDALLQSIDLAVAAEELGADGAYFRVHHFANQLASPFPLLAAVGAKTSTIEIGTAVIDMRYENPLYMVEDAGAADLISGGRLQLGISRGSPEQVIEGYRYFGYVPAEGTDQADMAREHTRVFLEALKGEGFAEPNPRPMFLVSRSVEVSFQSSATLTACTSVEKVTHRIRLVTSTAASHASVRPMPGLRSS
jgi:hypothetical protein